MKCLAPIDTSQPLRIPNKPLWPPSTNANLCLALLVFAALSGCDGRHASGLYGTWHATKVQWMGGNNDFDASTINVAEHGSALLSIRSDSTYEVRAEVLKDITIERKLLGREVTETLVPAIFKTYRTGNFLVKDSVLDLLAEDKSIFVHGIYKLWDDEITITFEDSRHQRWWSSWKHS